jgi:peptidoglycan/LPS O-acetylase OafA/YrhL
VKRLVCVSADHRGNNFDAIRLAMALLVVWSHSFAIHLGDEKMEWISLLLNGAYNAGNLAVMAFFIISGFLITQSFERSRTLRSYMEKRVRRIYPGYLVATSITAFIIAPLFGAQLPNVAKTIGLNLLLRNELPNAFFSNPLPLATNGSLWSIPFEFWCYIGGCSRSAAHQETKAASWAVRPGDAEQDRSGCDWS